RKNPGTRHGQRLLSHGRPPPVLDAFDEGRTYAGPRALTRDAARGMGGTWESRGLWVVDRWCALHPQPATRNPQPATRNPQPATRNPQPATRNPRNPRPGKSSGLWRSGRDVSASNRIWVHAL